MEALARSFGDALAAWHAEHPLRPGIPRRDLRRGPLAALSERAFDALADRLATAGRIAFEGPLVRDAAFSISLDASQRAALERMGEEIRAAGLDGTKAADLLARSPDLVHLLIDRKAIERVGDQLIASTVLASLAASVRSFLGGHDSMTPSDFKELTGLTRKHAIPLLEWLDRSGVTVRAGDDRRLAHTR